MDLQFYMPKVSFRMIPITPCIALDEKEIVCEFVRSSGPGGQNVNKVATAVQLRFDVKNSSSLPDGVRSRLVQLAGRKMTEQGVLIIEAKRFRSQEQNRQDALDRLVALIRNAAHKPRPRKKTKPTRASRERLLAAKRHRSRIKRMRRRVGTWEE
jgi:ribosome-associated protein